MLKHLFLFVLLAVATVSVSLPAHAAALTPNLNCGVDDGAPGLFIISCYAQASGGLKPYTYRWYVNSTFRKEETLTTGYSTTSASCRPGFGSKTILLVVTDSTGAQASQSDTYC